MRGRLLSLNFVVVTLFYQIFACLSSFSLNFCPISIVAITTVLLVENFDVELTDEPTTVYNFPGGGFCTYYAGGL